MLTLKDKPEKARMQAAITQETYRQLRLQLFQEGLTVQEWLTHCVAQKLAQKEEAHGR